MSEPGQGAEATGTPAAGGAGGGPEPQDLETPTRQRSFGQRLVAALRLDATLFEEVEHDPSALGQALGVVALAALASGLGGLDVSMIAVLDGVVSAVFGWLLGAGLVWLIGVKALDATSDFRELLRTLGFASAPQLVLVLGVLPLGPFRVPLGVAVLLWSLIAYILAVRAALDVQVGAAVGICLAALAIRVVLGLMLGMPSL